jgi:hypothetical protein
MLSAGKSCFLLFVVAALLGGTSTGALSQAKRKGQPRTGRTARVGGTARASLTPTAVLKAYYQAAIIGDIKTAKKYLSAGTLRWMDEADRRRKGQSLEDALREDARRNQRAMPSFGDESIAGATATVVVTQGWRTLTLPMVKEAGQWKLALDKLAAGMPEKSPPAPPAAEGDYSEDEKHRLFQTVGITRDSDLIIEVAQKIGIVDSRGGPKPNFDAFVKAHYEWAAVNTEFIQQHLDKEKAREYVMAHK